MKISILIPLYNEENTVIEILEKVNKQNNETVSLEIIVIDDNSSDGTKEILQEKIKDKVSQLIFNESNHGKGYCVKKGIENANGDVILIQDADLEYDPKEYYKLINHDVYLYFPKVIL